MSPSASFVVEQFQLQALAGDFAQGVDDPLEPFGVLAAPDRGFVAIGQQAQPDTAARAASYQEYEILARLCGERRRERLPGGSVSLVWMVTSSGSPGPHCR